MQPVHKIKGISHFLGTSSNQGASGGARTLDRKVPADLRADLLSTVPSTHAEFSSLPVKSLQPVLGQDIAWVQVSPGGNNTADPSAPTPSSSALLFLEAATAGPRSTHKQTSKATTSSSSEKLTSTMPMTSKQYPNLNPSL
ncbi:hypothetical protein PoB_002216300 [Plakobranchus ocellatus]|uniref:Uncharacterized protein n=1 Tax=Plakobranchus ocellatus TaxID=259542 RepID=A0AAV3ZLE5_9GAST|nr:hypothetical protein PoB_002216300 [Plakobranchus ocellatus]